jgi:hypothetical protein
MGFEQVTSLTLELSAACEQYRFVEMANAGKISRANAVSDDAVGITLEGRTAQDITDGKTAVPVAIPGCRCKITAGAAIDVSAAIVAITTDASGRAVAVAAATDVVYGYALQSASGAGVVIDMLFIKKGSHRDA